MRLMNLKLNYFNNSLPFLSDLKLMWLMITRKRNNWFRFENKYIEPFRSNYTHIQYRECATLFTWNSSWKPLFESFSSKLITAGRSVIFIHLELFNGSSFCSSFSPASSWWKKTLTKQISCWNKRDIATNDGCVSMFLSYVMLLQKSTYLDAVYN